MRPRLADRRLPPLPPPRPPVQERATKISHGNTARLANYHGDTQLAKICGLIAADEGRHEMAYQAIIAEVIRRDPDGGVLAFADMMKKGILMPAHLMDDDWHGANNRGQNLFEDFANVADAIGVYTTSDYANIVQYLVRGAGPGEGGGAQGLVRGGVSRVGSGGGRRCLPLPAPLLASLEGVSAQPMITPQHHIIPYHSTTWIQCV